MGMAPDAQDLFFVVIVGGGTGSGVFVYSPSPGAGKLVASVTGASGTDQYGNAYLAGVSAYSGTAIAAELTAGALRFAALTSPAFSPPADFTTNAAAAGAALNVSSGAGTGAATPATISLLDSLLGHGGVSQAVIGRLYNLLVPLTSALLEVQGSLALGNAALPAFAANAFQAASVAGILTGVNGSGGLSGAVALDQSDATTFTITATGANQASKAWSIPANDANAGTIYELEVWGTGTEGSTAQNLTIGAAVDGATVRSTVAAALTASGAFRFHARMLLHVKTTGAGGTYDLAADGAWDTVATPGVAGAFAFGSSASGGEALNTTLAHTFQLNLGWAATTGAPTITTLGSRFTRRGP